jgi:multidrug efflux pump subunit AcrA (membrane-fusion protein)
MSRSIKSGSSHRCVAAIVLGTCLLPGCNSAARPPEEKVPPAPVKWEGARQLFLEEWTELVGTTQPLPDHAARVTAPVEGRVLGVLPSAGGQPISEGQPVQKGAVLVQLDTSALLANRDKAEAAKKVAQAEKESAEFAVKQAALEVKRLGELKRQQEAPGASGLRLVASIELEKAEMALQAAQSLVRTTDRKLEAADKETAALDQQIQLYTLTAPRAGRLGRLQVVVGQTLSVGAVVADIVDIKDEIDVLCFVPAADARKLQLGQSARIGGIDKDSAHPAADAEGRLAFIADQAEAESGLLAVKVRFLNRDLKMRANAVVRIRVLTQPGKACWAIPEAALMEDQEPPSIIVVEDVETKKNADGKEEETGKAKRLQAVIGVRDRVLKQVEILRLEDPDKKWKGNLESALVVVEKGRGLQTGDAVRLEVEEDEEAPTPPKPEEKKP